MGIKFEVTYHRSVVEDDIPKLGAKERALIKIAIEDKLMTEPETFGKPLRRSLAGYRKLRVSDYRIIFRIEKKIVKIFCIGHRSVVYNKANKRT